MILAWNLSSLQLNNSFLCANRGKKLHNISFSVVIVDEILFHSRK
jgi:hypothetical protein